MSERDPYDPYDPNRPSQPEPPAAPPAAPQWGTNPPPSAQPPQYGGQPQYGQPQYGQPQYGQPAGSPPPNYLVWAILATIFCCLPLGIVSIVFAAQVNGKHTAGDAAGAQDASRKAKLFAIWSVAVGVAILAIYLVGIVILAGLASS